MSELAIILLSGGLDSCVTTAIAAERHPLALLHVSYGQRTARRERQAFDQIADFYRVQRRLVADLGYLRQIGGSALTDDRIPVPTSQHGLDGFTTELSATGQIPLTYVPFRNTHLLAIAVSWAEVLGATRIFIGAVAQDSSGYPDCRPEYYAVFNQLVAVGTKPGTHIEVETPLIHLHKSEIVRKGVALGAPLHLTWSCYQAEDRACGRCESCLLRIRAFRQAGVPDPISYSEHANWQVEMGSQRFALQHEV
ncbi:MAG: 7-cyano-7-deazaguanine synthase QueC [Acidobacteriota bacterium]|nr:7-cyano-7-deazaguanine synthase QueC [Blastocatellia bacterium]MDW8239878.1 7-cyano-7-deazaguanine synthase QueC [Acidobacteriota bacterium]